jgi:hypothetical protein
MEKFLLAFSLTVTFAALVYSNQRNSLLNHQSLILTKERAIFSQREKELKNEIDSLKSKLSSIKETKVEDSKLLVKTEAPKPIVVSQEEKLSRPEWEAKVSLRKVEERLALTADERAQLEERFKNGAKLSSLSEVVGKEKAERFFEEEENARKAEEEEVLKEKLFKLSRVLGLNSDQEIQVTQVLKSSREVLKNSYLALKQQEEKAIALHSEPNSGGELRAVYEKYRTDLEQINNRENSILTEEFRRILSEEQLNKFLEYQATEKTGLR